MESYLSQLKSGVPDYVCSKLNSLSDNENTSILLYEFFIERAGIREYDAHMKSTEAESEALKDTLIYFYKIVSK